MPHKRNDVQTRTKHYVEFCTKRIRWLTASRLPALLPYRPCFPRGVEGQRQLRVVMPEGQDLAGGSAELRELISASCGGPVELLHLKQGIYDEAYLITVATIRR